MAHQLNFKDTSSSDGDYLSASPHGLSFRIYPEGEDGESKKGKPGLILWELWYDNLEEFGYVKTLREAKSACQKVYDELS